MLRMISDLNNNKFYEMIYEGGSTFTVNYGRIELTKTTIKKPYSEWHKIIREKEKKGYKNVTHLLTTKVEETSPTATKLTKIENSRVDTFITLMQNYTKGLVAKTYNVKTSNVTKLQLQEAQGYIDQLTKVDRNNQDAVNKILLDLYTVIPRWIKDVRLAILPNINLDVVHQQEQDNLDALLSQVNIAKEEAVETVEKQNTLLDILGVKMDIVDLIAIPNEIKYITDGIKEAGRVIESIYTVNKPSEKEILQKRLSNRPNKETSILIHGTKPTSCIPILQQGLLIKPTGNFSFSGKDLGTGNYFANRSIKSLSYVGSDIDKIFLIYEVHTGNKYFHKGRNSYSEGGYWFDRFMQQNPEYDSLHALAGKNGANDYFGLINDEIVVFQENQQTIKYIVHMK